MTNKLSFIKKIGWLAILFFTIKGFFWLAAMYYAGSFIAFLNT